MGGGGVEGVGLIKFLIFPEEFWGFVGKSSEVVSGGLSQTRNASQLPSFRRSWGNQFRQAHKISY